jgi:hypothetical protein
LQTLRDNHLFAKLSKCSFGRSEVVFLGHVLSKDGLKVDFKKTAAVTEWPVPTDLPQLRPFLGLANYFRKSIHHYATLVTPLTDLTRKDRAFVWSLACQSDFQAVKQKLSCAPVLALPDFTQPLEVVCDASGFGLGAVILQHGRPIAFESRKLTPAEKSYTTIDNKNSLELFMPWEHGAVTWRGRQSLLS